MFGSIDGVWGADVIIWFLVHLRRFFMAFLMAFFPSVIVVPLFFNIAKISFGNFASDDWQYIISAALPAAIGLLYVLARRHVVNSDQVKFYIGHRFKENKRMQRRFYTTAAILQTRVNQYDYEQSLSGFKQVIEHEKVNLGLTSDEQVKAAAQMAAYKDIIMSIVSTMNLTHIEDETRVKIEQIYIAALKDHPPLDRELKYLRKLRKNFGPYLSECYFVLLVSTLVREHFKSGDYNYLQLFDAPEVKTIGAILLDCDESKINMFFYSRYLNVLEAEHNFWQHDFKERQRYEEARRAWEEEQRRAKERAEQYANEHGGSNEGFSTDEMNGSYSQSSSHDGSASHDGSSSQGGSDSSSSSSSQGSSSSNSSDYSGFHYRFNYDFSDGFGQFKEHFKDKFGQGFSGFNGFNGFGNRGGQHGSNGSNQESQRFYSHIERAYLDLQLPINAPLPEVKKQFRKLAFKYHPDHIKDYETKSEAEKEALKAQFNKISQAYNLIMEEHSKR